MRLEIPLLLLASCQASISPDPASKEAFSAHQSPAAALEQLLVELRPSENTAQTTYCVRSQTPSHAPRPYMVRTAEQVEAVSYQIFDSGDDLLSIRKIDSGNSSGAHFRDDEVSGFSEALPAGEHLHRSLLARAAVPFLLVQFAARQNTDWTIQSGNARTVLSTKLPSAEIEFHLLAFDPLSGTPRLQLHAANWKVHDALLGDTEYRLHYPVDTGTKPSPFADYELLGPQAMRISARQQAAEAKPMEPTREIDQTIWRAAATRTELQNRASCELRWIGQDLAEILIPHYESRVLALANDDGWIVLEAPVSVEVGESIIKILQAARPDLPFLYVLASHHHPHYVGAFPAFVAQGATAVVPEDVAPYVVELLHRPRSLNTEINSLQINTARVLGVARGERWSPPGLEQRLIAIEANGQSMHTDAFMIFALPQHQIGFGGDLLWLPREDGTRPMSARTMGLAKLVYTEPSIQEFLTSWPVCHGHGLGLRWKNRAKRTDLISIMPPAN